ncbi:peroxisomal membrane protein PEX14 [Drosophila sechellia]|uniref:Peroxisomal membrane protein PEX14 n=1 Tax=Drosophila sechellia TaxID=7238 RepID=B4IAF3_DROSE|nr:peroxisomal membrane protein PEX14 [Drosophila sechellia]EDW44266.1 GM22319 [Drosophila sechellia]
MSSNNTDTGDTTVMATATSVQHDVEADVYEQLPRESLITTAVSFLQNTKVRHTTLIQKQQFLRSKGLTAHEIQLACERAGVFTQDPNNPNSSPNTVISIGSQLHALQPQPTALGRIREIIHSAALFSGVVYAVYLFWKKYIAPYLFGKPKKKAVDEVLDDIDKKVDTRTNDLNKEILAVRDLITTQQREHAQQLNREFSNFRSDLDAIKGLLLNRKQFAGPVATIAVPSIPAWQLAGSPHHHHRHSGSDDNEKGDDAGSGSGSSETEVVTKNSDSSLEIM